MFTKLKIIFMKCNKYYCGSPCHPHSPPQIPAAVWSGQHPILSMCISSKSRSLLSPAKPQLRSMGDQRPQRHTPSAGRASWQRSALFFLLDEQSQEVICMFLWDSYKTAPASASLTHHDIGFFSFLCSFSMLLHYNFLGFYPNQNTCSQLQISGSALGEPKQRHQIS